jgi:hypothetical protein
VSYTEPISQIIGAYPAARLITQMATALQFNDYLPEKTALRLAADRVAEGDPRWIAAIGQTWVIHPDLAKWRSPHERLVVKERDHSTLLVVPVNADGTRPEEHIDVSALDAYQLETWLPIDPELCEDPAWDIWDIA